MKGRWRRRVLKPCDCGDLGSWRQLSPRIKRVRLHRCYWYPHGRPQLPATSVYNSYQNRRRVELRAHSLACFGCAVSGSASQGIGYDLISWSSDGKILAWNLNDSKSANSTILWSNPSFPLYSCCFAGQRLLCAGGSGAKSFVGNPIHILDIWVLLGVLIQIGGSYRNLQINIAFSFCGNGPDIQLLLLGYLLRCKRMPAYVSIILSICDSFSWICK